MLVARLNGENNHVHLLVNFPPKVAVTKLVIMALTTE
ncbi:transposase [Streptomyces sp. NPDC055056]